MKILSYILFFSISLSCISSISFCSDQPLMQPAADVRVGVVEKAASENVSPALPRRKKVKSRCTKVCNATYYFGGTMVAASFIMLASTALYYRAEVPKVYNACTQAVNSVIEIKPYAEQIPAFIERVQDLTDELNEIAALAANCTRSKEVQARSSKVKRELRRLQADLFVKPATLPLKAVASMPQPLKSFKPKAATQYASRHRQAAPDRNNWKKNHR